MAGISITDFLPGPEKIKKASSLFQLRCLPLSFNYQLTTKAFKERRPSCFFVPVHINKRYIFF